ncbi:hypothetical protein Daura_35095 [Dactylosporangium aurantiacum]|uniref:Protoporphyrinogen oxidase n=1 Tax=Dactylosporangium aurantiacum TaxID=35754 RepID=A0A9Q9MAJ2_9ACTN|nr:hypothetical protein [Dactylosporangium aurantiacum]MDG6103600.1 hypothetical protein [Dactylosporangium aurantiacum]UWZ51908.1 hypothetical protein Daura_35095 [Dactylosporangium aurantiacum]
MRLLTLAAGLATGYVLGTRAGRGKYEQIVEGARQLRANPTLAQAQQTARKLATSPASPAAVTDSASSMSSSGSSAASPGAKHLTATSSGSATPAAMPGATASTPKAPRKASATTGKTDPLA